MFHSPVLLLNQNYEPLTVLKLRRAVNLLLLGKVDLIENDHSGSIRSINIKIPVPSVLRLKYYVQIKRKEIPLNKKNILKRDNYECQYCGKKGGQMTTDHVIPKALGGEDSWENLVCACVECNNRKGNRTLQTANIKLRKKPKKPSYFTFVLREIGKPDERWRPYLFQS